MVRTASLAANPERGGGDCEFSTPLANGGRRPSEPATLRPKLVLFRAPENAGATRPGITRNTRGEAPRVSP